MEEKLIDLQITPDELSIIFTCLIGSASCPPDHCGLVDKVYALVKEHNVRKFNVYCK